MHTSPDRLDAGFVSRALGGAAGAPWRIEVRERCASTNTELLAAAEAGAAHASVLACEIQSAGRGRRGRSWQTVPGGSLAFSALWRFAPGTPPPMGLSLAVGLAVARALEAAGAQGVSLKWPNDVLHAGRKLAGILIELASGSAAAPAAVIGIGVNLRLPPGFSVDSQLPPTDLASALAHPPGRNELLAALLRELAPVLDAFGEGGFAALREDWLRRQAYRGETVSVSDEPGGRIVGRCAGVDRDGALLLDTAQGRQRVLSGDVSLRPVP